MTANTQDTTSTHPLAGLLKTAATSSKAERGAESDSAENFGEILEALVVTSSNPEIDTEQETAVLPILNGDSSEIESPDTAKVASDDIRTGIDTLDGTDDAAKATDAFVPIETKPPVPDFFDRGSWGAPLVEDREGLSASSGPPNETTIEPTSVEIREPRRDAPNLTMIDDNMVVEQNYVSPEREVGQEKLDPTKVVNSIRGISNPIREPSPHADARGPDIGLVQPDDAQVGDFTQTSHLDDTGIAQTGTPSLQGRDALDILKTHEVVTSTQVQALSQAEGQPRRDNIQTSVELPIKQPSPQGVGSTASLNDPVGIELGENAEPDLDSTTEMPRTKQAPSNAAPQTWQSSTVVLGATQEVLKVDLGFASFGDIERGYAELPKLETMSSGSSSPTLATASTAQYASHQIARVAQSQPGGPVELALNPEELGRVKLTFTSHENTLIVTIVGERSDTIDLMRRHIDSLSQEFKNIGYSNVSFSFSQNENGGFSGEESSKGGSSRNADGAQELELLTDENVQTILSQTGLDIRI